MRQFTFDDLKRIMRECAGEDEQLNLDGHNVLNLSFEDLGYDSLALMETTSRIEDALDVRLPEDEMAGIATPGEYLAFINQHLSETV